MALSEFEIKKIEKPVKAYCENRYPKHMRSQLYLDYRIEDQSVIIFAVRPHWKNENEIMEEKIAKATYVKSKKEWKIYWQRQDLKWHIYEPVSVVGSIEAFLSVIDNDEYACFYG